MSEQGEIFYFQADINQIVTIFINSVYSNKDVFLRELISNASDALDKIRYKILSGKEQIPEEDRKITIVPNKEEKILTLCDNGIGMTKAELIQNLGTLARSGTKEFLQMYADTAKKDFNCIGQFGIGFYSVFLVAEEVYVYSKCTHDEMYLWQSRASGSFQIRTAPEETFTSTCGTKIIIKLKEDYLEYLDDKKLKEIIKTHSGFINYPIYLMVEKSVTKEVSDDEAEPPTSETKKEDISEQPQLEEVADESNKKEKKKVTEKKKELEHVNNIRPVISRKPEEVSPQDYAELYKSLSNDWEDHLAVKHFSLEGQLEFTAVLFIPKRAPFDLFDNKKKKSSISLYNRRVLVMKNAEDMLPEYLNFVKGMVDAADLPLNISREHLQQNKVIKIIRKNLVKKVFEAIEDVVNNEEDYKKFYEQFSKNLKLGVHEDSTNRNQLANFLKFHSSKSGDSQIFLKDYVKNMKPDQKGIYYITGESLENVRNSPFIEKLVHKYGYEVLFLVDPIDEYCVSQLKNYESKELIGCTKEGLESIELEEEKAEYEEATKKYESFLKFAKEIIGTKHLDTVCISKRLVVSPCCIVTGKHGWTANMERIMKAQALRDSSTMGYMAGKKHLELNAKHPLFLALYGKFEKDDKDPTLKSIILLIFNTALLIAGFNVISNGEYGKSIFNMCCNALDCDIDYLPQDFSQDNLTTSVQEADAQRMEEVD
uniref:Hsp 90-alpha n=1 Tax=Tetracapsuloides bryosalmonae TaxID=271932 RepID=A0A859IQP1_9CNID|nr:Hsp 90-alpha [Tetracapsuloides bryosalmonae]